MNVRRAPDGMMGDGQSRSRLVNSAGVSFHQGVGCRIVSVYQRVPFHPHSWPDAALSMLVRHILLIAIVAATTCPAWSQVSSALPPQTIGTLSTDREPPTDLQQVQQLMAANRLPQALARADEHLAKNPRDAQMRFVRGVILTELKQTQQAREVFQKLTEEFPELPEPYNNLAVIYARRGSSRQCPSCARASDRRGTQLCDRLREPRRHLPADGGRRLPAGVEARSGEPAGRSQAQSVA